MTQTIDQFIDTECKLSQIKYWLKSEYHLSMEEFIILYCFFGTDKITGKVLRDSLHYDMKWNTSKIDVLIRKLYKRELIAKERSETDERQVFYLLNDAQRLFVAQVIKEFKVNAK
ncbi:transcriptional regulator, SarA/Rot family [Staphylococcus simulans]|uniref:transcriptional regulator, SarA/Rot family n=1 Tax=Staphylococcus simulans TaxID=1286 RepID=UPI003F7D293B